MHALTKNFVLLRIQVPGSSTTGLLAYKDEDRSTSVRHRKGRAKACLSKESESLR